MVDATEFGKHFGLVGVGGVTPAEESVPKEERIRRELLEVLKYDATDGTPASDAAADSLEGTGSRRES